MLYFSYNKKGHKSGKCEYMYDLDKLEVAKRVLNDLQCDILNGEFDGWGLDERTVCIVWSWLHNIENGVYGDRIHE